jgi:hypothetical protein
MQCIESGSDFFQLSMVFINAGADVGLRDVCILLLELIAYFVSLLIFFFFLMNDSYKE